MGTWNPENGYPSLWTPAGGIGTGGLGVIATHLTDSTTVWRWANNLGAPVKVVQCYSEMDQNVASTGVGALSLEQPSGAADHLNFYIHNAETFYNQQTFPAPYIVVNVGDALTFQMSGVPAGAMMVIKAFITF